MIIGSRRMTYDRKWLWLSVQRRWSVSASFPAHVWPAVVWIRKNTRIWQVVQTTSKRRGKFFSIDSTPILRDCYCHCLIYPEYINPYLCREMRCSEQWKIEVHRQKKKRNFEARAIFWVPDANKELHSPLATNDVSRTEKKGCCVHVCLASVELPTVKLLGTLTDIRWKKVFSYCVFH